MIIHYVKHFKSVTCPLVAAGLNHVVADSACIFCALIIRAVWKEPSVFSGQKRAVWWNAGDTHADYCIKGLECLWGQMCLEATHTGKDRLIGWKHKRGKGQLFLHHGAAMDRCQTQRQKGTWLVVLGKVKSFYSTILLVLPETECIMFTDNSKEVKELCSQRRGYRVDSSMSTCYIILFYFAV